MWFLIWTVLALAALCSTFILMAWTFIVAYTNDDKSVLVTINSIGEANLELAFLIFCTIVTVPWVVALLKRLV